MFIVFVNMAVALVLVLLYRRQKKRGWFKDNHLKIPEWMSIAAVPLGLLMPVSPGAVDMMFIFAAAWFGNEKLYLSTGYSPLGWIISKIDVWVLRRKRVAEKIVAEMKTTNSTD